MAVVGTDSASTVSGSLTLTIPVGAVSGDVAEIIWIISNSDGYNTPSGFTQVETADYGNARYARFLKTLGSGEGGTNITLTPVITAQKHVAVLLVQTDVDGADPEGPETPAVSGSISTTTDRPIPSSSVTDTRETFSFVFTRGSTPPTVWTPPAGWTLLDSAFTTGSGATTVAIASRTYSAGSIGGGNWTSDVAEGRGGAGIVVFNPAEPPPVPTSGPPPVPWPQFDTRIGGGSDTWDTAAGVLLIDDYFDDPQTVIAVKTSGGYAYAEIFRVKTAGGSVTVELLGTWNGSSMDPVES